MTLLTWKEYTEQESLYRYLNVLSQPEISSRKNRLLQLIVDYLSNGTSSV